MRAEAAPTKTAARTAPPDPLATLDSAVTQGLPDEAATLRPSAVR